MDRFTITNLNEITVEIELVFHTFTSNTWSVIGGDATILPVTDGTWSSEGIENIVNFFDASGNAVMTFFEIDVATLSTDRFKHLKPGDTGPVLLIETDGATWTFISSH